VHALSRIFPRPHHQNGDSLRRRCFRATKAHRSGHGDRKIAVDRYLAHLFVDMLRRYHPWTIAELAEAVGVSRTSLVDRFAKYVSEPPMTYLTRWRLQLAAQALTTTPRGVADIAAEVGYESEAAFNRAFKRLFGTPPARYRREQRSANTLVAAKVQV
jgi:AraC-like DNA-binding protein